MMKNKIQSNYRESSWMFDLNSYNGIDFVFVKLNSLNNCPFMIKDIIGFIRYNIDIVIPSKPIQIHDINPYSFKDTKEFNWMINNSYKYGFILRYPKGKENITGFKYEPWHYRYVGKDIAKYIYENNLTLEEYKKRTN